MSKRPELLITTGKLKGKKYSVGEGGLRLGRSSSNDVHVPDEELSRNHCLFEPVGDDGIRLTDLASANGTFLNGREIGDGPVSLKAGDLVGVGKTVIKVVGEQVPEPVVDLGLGTKKHAAPTVGKKRSPLMNVALAASVVVALVSIYLLLTTPKTATEDPETLVEDPKVKEVWYEKVEADSESIFRYEMSLSPDGVMTVSVDDVPKEERHLTKSEPLGENARAELEEILAWKNMREFDREYAGEEPNSPALKSWTLKVVYDRRVRRVKIVNTQEPEAFQAIREKLETFSKNQLGIWAIQYSRDKLIKLAEDSLELGKTKWQDRDVNHGNLFESVAAFRESLFYLKTIEPKPKCAQIAQSGLEEAMQELDRRYRDQRFLADRAINLGQWEIAQRELTILMDMIPDRDDDRNREASAKLMDIEKRMKKGGK